MIQITGAKGGGKGGSGGASAPTEDPDSLRSRQYARVLDLIGDGEYEGLVDGLRSVCLDGTPAQNADGTFNFNDVKIATRNGTQEQSHIPGFSDVESEQAVSQEVLAATPIVRTISNPNVNAVRITVGTPVLTETDTKTGDLHGATVEWAVDIQSNGGGFVTQMMGSDWIGTGVVSSSQFTTAVETGGLRGRAKLNRVAVGGVMQPISYTLDYRRVGVVGWTNHATKTNQTQDFDFSIVGLPQGRYELRLAMTSMHGSLTMINTQLLGVQASDVIKGKATSKYQRSKYIFLTGSPPWDIRVRRITPDSLSSHLNNKLIFESYTEIINTKLRYPNSALVGLSVDASQFRNIPQRAYRMRLMRIRIPSNYDPITRQYSGSWDGTFKIAWSNNPAWVFYDLVTNERYGAGSRVPEALTDKWALYNIGRYCDGMVPDGKGGMEPRFTCNVYLQERMKAAELLQSMASIFRGMIYWAGGAVTVTQDSPADPVAIYTPANIIGDFTYSGSSKLARHTVALVSYNDDSNFGKRVIEYVAASDELIARFGYIETQVVAVGCNSQGQANRCGKWLLATEELENDTVVFRVGLEGLKSRPGQICKIADPKRSGVEYGGRIISASTTQITLDRPVVIEPGQSYNVTVVAPDGTVLNDLPITNLPGTATQLNLATPVASAPQVMAIWLLQSNIVKAQLFRVLSASEIEPNVVELVALNHVPDKYAHIENGLKLEERSISVLSQIPEAPKNIVTNEYLYEDQNNVYSGLSVSWDPMFAAARYQVIYRRDNDNWVAMPASDTNLVDIRNTQPGAYSIKIFALNVAGGRSVPAQLNISLLGKSAPPANITGLTMQAISSMAVLRWDLHPDLDVTKGGRILVRHSEAMTGATWENSYSIGEIVPGNANTATVPLKGGTYLLKAQDSGENKSASAAKVTTKSASVMTFTTLGSVQEDPLFPGTHTGTIGVDSHLKLTGAGMFDDIPSVDDLDSFDDAGGVRATGTYKFAAGIDLLTVKRFRLETSLELQAVNVNDRIDSRSTSMDDWEDFDGVAGGGSVDAYIEVRETDDNPALLPVWSEWKRIHIGDYYARAVELRAVLVSSDPTRNLYVTKLRATAKEMV